MVIAVSPPEDFFANQPDQEPAGDWRKDLLVAVPDEDGVVPVVFAERVHSPGTSKVAFDAGYKAAVADFEVLQAEFDHEDEFPPVPHELFDDEPDDWDEDDEWIVENFGDLEDSGVPVEDAVVVDGSVTEGSSKVTFQDGVPEVKPPPVVPEQK